MAPDIRLAGTRLSLAALALATGQVVLAGHADVLAVTLTPAAQAGRFDVAVTLRHGDTGWDHYADRWEILGAQGEVLATRVLAHPHILEQPFTRQLANVAIPRPLTWIRVRAHDRVHGYGGREVTVSVP